MPISAARMEQQGVASGIALMVEQEPLLKRAEKRRHTFKVYECDLARRTLVVTANHYGMPELMAAAEKPEARLNASGRNRGWRCSRWMCSRSASPRYRPGSRAI